LVEARERTARLHGHGHVGGLVIHDAVERVDAQEHVESFGRRADRQMGAEPARHEYIAGPLAQRGDRRAHAVDVARLHHRLRDHAVDGFRHRRSVLGGARAVQAARSEPGVGLTPDRCLVI
jgi:hypothetical protein